MKDILNHSHYYDYNWGNEIKRYDYDKTHLAWRKNPNPEKMTTKMVIKNDQTFNPILQKYNDKEFETNLRKREKSAVFSSIATNLDNQLKYEQTFNIINLQDRFKGFEKHPNYPTQKNVINKKKVLDPYSKNYNIISNYPLNEHHYDKPENRPLYNDVENNKKRKLTYNYGHEKDFNIITTKYKQFNDEKEKIDKEVNKIQTAKSFYKNNNYNPIECVYYNHDKEKEYQAKIKEEQKNWGKERIKTMPKCAKGSSDIYDLISLKIVDQQGFNNILKEEKIKRKKYEIRNQLEEYYHEENLKAQDKEENIRKSRSSYSRYKEEDKREYDIIDLKKRPFMAYRKKMNKTNAEGWEKIVKDAGNNNTFKTKSLYGSPNDYIEIGLRFDKFKINRNKTLSNLPNIEDDKLFSSKNNTSKNAFNKNTKNNRLQKTFSFNKDKFFKGPPKNADMKDNKYRIITGNKDYTGKKDEYKRNREINVRNLKKNFDFRHNFKKKK